GRANSRSWIPEEKRHTDRKAVSTESILLSVDPLIEPAAGKVWQEQMFLQPALFMCKPHFAHRTERARMLNGCSGIDRDQQGSVIQLPCRDQLPIDPQ